MFDKVSRTVSAVGEYVLLIVSVIVASVQKFPHWPIVRDQLFIVGVASLPVVAITGFSTGMVLAAQAFFQLSDKGLAAVTGLMVTKAMMVELGPILTAFMVTGRVGSAMCAEIGTMKVTEQVDALNSMAVNPMRYLLAPRMIAGVLMLPLLTVFSALTGVIGGYMVAVHVYGMAPNVFLDPLPLNIHAFDFIMMTTKALVFGIIIVTVSCFQGLRTKGGAAGVGRSTTHSVVVCYSIILIVNFVLTVGLNSSYTYIIEVWNAWF